MKLLALDVGDRRIGVAVSDATGLIATPLTVIRRASKAKDFDRIAQLIQEQGVSGLVIGQPLNTNGSAGPQARRVERYSTALVVALNEKGLDLPILFWDERMSTQRAREILFATGRKAREHRQWIDAVAAAVILQDYLDEHRPGPLFDLAE
jgi:putative Holliday junction resolvase